MQEPILHLILREIKPEKAAHRRRAAIHFTLATQRCFDSPKSITSREILAIQSLSRFRFPVSFNNTRRFSRRPCQNCSDLSLTNCTSKCRGHSRLYIRQVAKVPPLVSLFLGLGHFSLSPSPSLHPLPPPSPTALSLFRRLASVPRKQSDTGAAAAQHTRKVFSSIRRRGARRDEEGRDVAERPSFR